MQYSGSYKHLNYARRTLAFSVMLSLVWSAIYPAAYAAKVSSSYEKKEKTTAALMAAILPGMQSTEQVLTLLALGKVPEGELRSIGEDIQKRLGKMPVPQLSMEKNKILADGQPTGITIASYHPLQIKFHGKSWTHEQENSAAENYFSLVKFLSPAHAKAWSDFLVPSAFAETGPEADKYIGKVMKGGAYGAIVGILGGLVTVLIKNPESMLPTMVTFVLLGTVAGASAGDNKGTMDRMQATRKRLVAAMKGSFTLSCDNDFVTLRFSSSPVSMIQVDRNVNLLKMTMEDGAVRTLPKGELGLLAPFLDCKNQPEADGIMKEWKRAQEMARAAMNNSHGPNDEAEDDQKGKVAR